MYTGACLTYDVLPEMKAVKSIYPSAVDAWIALCLIGTPLVPISMGLYQMSTSNETGTTLVIIGVFFAVFIFLVVIPCRYTVTNNQIVIRCGLLKKTIEISKIEGLSLSSDMTASPALSLKRVKIDYENSYLLISPNNRAAFIKEIESVKRGEG